MLHETHEMIPLIIHSILSDLNSSNELFQGMALSAVGSIGGKEMAESLAPSIEKLLMSTTTKTVVRKKAALGLLKLWRRQPVCIQIESMAEKLTTILNNEKSVGLLTSVMALALAFSEEHPKLFEPLIPAVVNVLNNVIFFYFILFLY